MTLAINDTAPDFEAQTTEGKIKFHEWIGEKWGVLFSHPKDFTPVCTTELGYMAKLKPDFDKRGAKIIGLSVDPIDRHAGWAKDIKETQGSAPNYPMIADVDHTGRSSTACCRPRRRAIRPCARRATTRPSATYLSSARTTIKLVLVYPMTAGRNSTRCCAS